MKQLKSVAINLAIALVTTLIAVLLLEVLRPNTIRQAQALLGMPLPIRFYAGMGDSFTYQGQITAPPPNPYEIISEYIPLYDADGFRAPQKPAERYQVIALGDSFTEAYTVAIPWTDVLANETGLSVRNLGVRGYGMIEEALIMKTYANDQSMDYVVVAFFEGNDVSNAESYYWTDFKPPLEVTGQETVRDNTFWQFVHTPQPRYKYPLNLTLNGKTTPMTFLEGFLWGLNVELADIAQSWQLEQIALAWRDIKEVAGEACVVMAYIPSKEHIYVTLLTLEERAPIFDTPFRQFLRDNGRLGSEPDPTTTYETLAPRLKNVNVAVVERAEQEGLAVLDLTPIFTQAAQEGALLYHVYDTHANQAGNDLIGKAVGEALLGGICTQ